MHIAIKKSDGSIVIMTLLGEAEEAARLAPDHLDVIVGAEISQWQRKDREAVASWREIASTDVPIDRTFRSAWRDDASSSGIDFDLEHCREIWKDRLRRAREPKLASLDVELMRKIERGGNVDDIYKKKQALRDVTKHPAIDAAKTPDELKAVWPDCLN